MYVIIVYDVNVEKVNKVCQYLRQYLNWVQNSVFEGELTESEYKKIETHLKELINSDTDSVIFYITQHEGLINKKQLGIKKTENTCVI